MLRRWTLVGMVVALVLAVGWQLASQEEPVRPPRERMQRGRMTAEQMQQMRQRMVEGLKQQLKCSDEDWKAIGPAVEKVQEAQRELRRYSGGRMSFFAGMRRGREGEAARRVRTAAEESPLAPLRKLVEQDKPAAGELKTALAKFRKARDAKRTGLKKHQKFLLEIVTPRQELVLVLAGILE